MNHDFVIHFGHRLAESIYDHDIPESHWKTILKSLRVNPELTYTCAHVKIYHLHSLTYEFDIDDPTLPYRCWTDTVTAVTGVKDITSFTPVTSVTPNRHLVVKHALMYWRHRESYKYDFQPVNTYYNVHQVTRHHFQNGSLLVICESTDTHHEIMIICHGDTRISEKDMTLIDSISDLLESKT